MKLNFKKIASVLASTVMLTSTMGFAAAANYPAPFNTQGGAVVYGSNSAVTDATAAIKVTNSISGTVATSTTTTSGEAIALFTGSSKINVNDSISIVKTVLTETELPTVLAKNTFSGNVDATIVQTIDVGSNPRLVFAKQPTSSDDPAFGFSLSTNTANYLYNATASFSRAVNFTHADSKNQEITLFGQKFTVGSGTDTTNIILFKSASKLNFDSTGTTSGEVTVDGNKYTIELVTASTTTATLAVTNEAGVTEQKEVTEGYSKKIGGITIAVNTADSNNQKYTASIVAGADKITLTTGSAVSVGDSGTYIDGTLVTLSGGTDATTKIVLSVTAKNSEVDSIEPGEAFVDPVFGSFKVDFAALNIADDSTVSREDIVVKASGDDKLQFTMTDNRGNEASVPFIKSWTTSAGPVQLQTGDDGLNIIVAEGQPVKKNEYVMVGNEDSGYLLKVSIQNSSSATDFSADKILFTNVFDSSETFESVESAEGVATVTIGGKIYNLNYFANDATTQDSWNVTLNYPDSQSTGEIVMFPTIQTSKGAKLMLYKPMNISLGNYSLDPRGDFLSRVTGIKLPNGNGYTDVTVVAPQGVQHSIWGFTVGGTTYNVTLNATDQQNITVGQLKYAISNAGAAAGSNRTLIRLQAPVAGVWTTVTYPALVIIEEKDDNSQYHAVVITTKIGTTSTNATAVDSVYRTWGGDVTFNAVSMASNSNIVKDADLFGTIITKDSSDTNHPSATISYPDEQIYADVYVAAASATITPGESSGGTGVLIAVEDSKIDSVKDRNLIVVGGSCVNKVALKLVDSAASNPICGAAFTDKTSVGATQYIIKSMISPYNSDKIAVLVAGYEASDTINAVNTLLEGAATDSGTSKVYPISSA